jgi:hypothetical protein
MVAASMPELLVEAAVEVTMMTGDSPSRSRLNECNKPIGSMDNILSKSANQSTGVMT